MSQGSLTRKIPTASSVAGNQRVQGISSETKGIDREKRNKVSGLGRESHLCARSASPHLAAQLQAPPRESKSSTLTKSSKHAQHKKLLSKKQPLQGYSTPDQQHDQLLTDPPAPAEDDEKMREGAVVSKLHPLYSPLPSLCGIELHPSSISMSSMVGSFLNLSSFAFLFVPNFCLCQVVVPVPRSFSHSKAGADVDSASDGSSGIIRIAHRDIGRWEYWQRVISRNGEWRRA